MINGSVKSALWFRRTDQEVCPSADRMCRYLLRKHHRIGDIHLTQGCAGARGLRGAVAHRLGVWRRDLRPRLHVLRRTGRHHPEVWRRLFLRDGNLRRARGVNVCTRNCHFKVSELQTSPGEACARGGLEGAGARRAIIQQPAVRPTRLYLN